MKPGSGWPLFVRPAKERQLKTQSQLVGSPATKESQLLSRHKKRRKNRPSGCTFLCQSHTTTIIIVISTELLSSIFRKARYVCFVSVLQTYHLLKIPFALRIPEDTPPKNTSSSTTTKQLGFQFSSSRDFSTNKLFILWSS